LQIRIYAYKLELELDDDNDYYDYNYDDDDDYDDYDDILLEFTAILTFHFSQVKVHASQPIFKKVKCSYILLWSIFTLFMTTHISRSTAVTTKAKLFNGI
jgi:hypothetical protein